MVVTSPVPLYLAKILALALKMVKALAVWRDIFFAAAKLYMAVCTILGQLTHLSGLSGLKERLMALTSSCRANGEIIITSGDRLTVDNAGAFSGLVREALDASRSVAVEFEPEVEIDITGVQILCSACKNAAAGGNSFSYHGPLPPSLADIIIACGAERHAACRHNNDFNCIWFGGAK